MKRLVNVNDLVACAEANGVSLADIEFGEPNDLEKVGAVVWALDGVADLAPSLILYLTEGEGELDYWSRSDLIAACAVFEDESIEKDRPLKDAVAMASAVYGNTVYLCDGVDNAEEACRFVAEEDGWFGDAPCWFNDDCIDWDRTTDDFEDNYRVVTVHFTEEKDGVDFTGTVVIDM